MTSILTRGTVTIDVDRCKGCDLCIEACRPGVLAMSKEVNGHGYHYPELEPGCTACKACFDVCPDFVFEVYRYTVPVKISMGPSIATKTPLRTGVEHGAA